MPYVAPLDIAGSAALAYSQRAMAAAYTGNAVSIRKNGGSTVNFNTASGNAVDVAAILAHLDGEPGFLTTWFDQSGNAHDGYQTNENNQALWVSSMLNGKPGFDTQGNGWVLTDIEVDITERFTAFVVARRDRYEGALFGINSGSGENSILCDTVSYAEGHPTFGIRDETVNALAIISNASQASVMGNHFLLEGVLDASEQAILLNGSNVAFSLVDNSAVLPIPAQRLSIGNDTTTASNVWGGALVEVLIYGRVLSSSERQAIRENIMTYYGIA